MSPAGNADNLDNSVRGLRRNLGITQEELGARVGLTRQSIIAIEKGRFTPSIHTVLMLARTLKTPVEEMFWLSDDKLKGGEK